MSDRSQAEKIAVLEQSTLFSELGREILRRLADRTHFRDYAAGELIFQAESPGESMMVVAQGKVRVSALAPTARDVILTELGQGDVFGEVALLDGGGRSADTHALTNCRVLVLERQTVLKVMRAAPDLAVTFLELLCARLRRSDERMMDFAFLQLPRRLARTLLGISAGGDGASAGPIRRLSQSQSELADMVGGSRENVNRCLGKWQADGFIDLDKGWIVLRDRAALQKIAEAG